MACNDAHLTLVEIHPQGLRVEDHSNPLETTEIDNVQWNVTSRRRQDKTQLSYLSAQGQMPCEELHCGTAPWQGAKKGLWQMATDRQPEVSNLVILEKLGPTSSHTQILPSETNAC